MLLPCFLSIGSNKIANPYYLLVVSLFFIFHLISSFHFFSTMIVQCPDNMEAKIRLSQVFLRKR